MTEEVLAMHSSFKIRRVLPLMAVALCAALLLTGCSGGRAANEATVSTAPLPPEQSAQMPYGAPSDASGGSEAKSADSLAAGSTDARSSAPMEQLVIRNASLQLRVKSVDAAVPKVREAAASAGAQITELNLAAGTGDPVMPESATQGPSTAYVTIRVPADKLDSLTTALSGLGKVVAQTESASDVTEQAIDLDARLGNLRAEEARLRTFMNRATKIDDLLAVERELARVRGEIESMDAQLTYLKRQAARATLTVTLSEPGPVITPAGPTWGLREAITRGIQGAVAVVSGLVMLAISLSPVIALGIVIWLIIRSMLRARRRRRGMVETSGTVASDDRDAS
jgi:hypothetical protein